MDLATDGVNAGRAEYLQQEHAQPVAYLRQRQGRCPLLPPVRLPDQEPYGHQRQGDVVMPALPGAHLILIRYCWRTSGLYFSMLFVDLFELLGLD